jgi:hypothetical protein
MTRMIFATALVSLVFGLQPAAAYQAPWCAVISFGPGSIYWDCQYLSFEDCYRRGNILAGNRGFCNASPYYVANATEYRRPAKRRTRSQ